MHLYFSEFIKGLHQKLNPKTAEEFPTNSSIFPTLDTQHSWKFAKTDNKLHLHDGNVIHAFSTGEKVFKEDEDFPVHKLEDASYFDFENGMTHKGTAQIHRANPGMIYVTLHDGEKNPTYTFTHVSDSAWRASPKTHIHKESSEIELEAFAKGLSEKVGFDIFKGLDTAGNYAIDGIRAIGEKPLYSALGGAALGGIYDLGKRTFYNTEEENKNETFGDRAIRYALPGALAGGLGLAERTLIPHHYDGGPLNRATNPGTHTQNFVPSKTEVDIQKAMDRVGYPTTNPITTEMSRNGGLK